MGVGPLDRGRKGTARCVPVRLGNYDLLKKIGSGGMAEVWMGRRGGMAGVTKAVAIKMLAQSLANEPQYRALFLEEARLSMLLSHSNVVQVFDVAQEGEASYLVMEWVDGLNLAQICELLRRSATAMPLAVTGYVIGELLHALAYAHTLTHNGQPLGIVHRDVSPQNVLVSVSGEVKLTDFGVARLASDDTSGLHIKGKLRYMAPEQLAGHSKAATVDLYAAGAILHELLDGHRFRGDGVDDAYLYGQVSAGVIPELCIENLPPELDILRRALLEPDPTRRLGTASDALAVLESWPGYRNASIELGKMCRWFMGVHAPRSGLQERVEAPRPSILFPVASSVEATRTSRQSRDADSDADTLPALGGPVPWLRRVLPAVVGTAALALGGRALWRYVQSADSGAVELAASPVPGGVAVAQDPTGGEGTVPAPDSDPVGSPLGDEPIADERGPGQASAGGSEKPGRPGDANKARSRPRTSRPSRTNPGHVKSEAEAGTRRGDPRARPKAELPPATVALRLAGPRLAFVRVDRDTVHVLQPTAEARLRPGRHRIEWRLMSEAPWQAAAPIRVRPGRNYVLRLSEDGPTLTEAEL